jgi:hypothetical protein
LIPHSFRPQFTYVQSGLATNKSNRDTRHYLIILMCYLHLALLAATAATAFSQSASEEPTSVNIVRQLAGNVDAQDDYPVEAYICLDDSSEVMKPAALWLGAKLQVCVKIDPAVTDNIIVENILNFVISQPDGTATDWETITNTVAVPMTDKVCHESGICHVKTHLLPRFFNGKNPGDLRVDGVAILAIGKAPIISSSTLTVEGTTPTVRHLRAPIRGLLTGEDVKAFMTAQQQQNNETETAIVSTLVHSAERMLQDGATLSEFGLDVSLKGVNSNDSSFIRQTLVIVAMLVAGSCVIVWLCAECCRRDDKREIMRFNSNTTNIQYSFRRNGTARAKANSISPGHPIRTIEHTNSQLFSTEENSMTDSDQQSTESIIYPPTKERGRSRGRSRRVEKEEVTKHHIIPPKNHSSLVNNDSTTRAKIPSSDHYTGTLECASIIQPAFTEEIGTIDLHQQSAYEPEEIGRTDPDQQSVDEPTNPTKESGTPKSDASLGKNDSAAQAKMPSSKSSHREDKEVITSRHSSTARSHSSPRKDISAARAIVPSSAAKPARPSLVSTRSAVESETSLRIELKALFEEKELTTALLCHTFFTQKFAHQDNIKIMSYSTFIAFMNETREEPLKKRHKQQLQMLLANNTEAQRASNCASLHRKQSADLSTTPQDPPKESGAAEIDARLENNESAAPAKMPSSGRPSLVSTRSAVESEASLRIELKALFEENDLTTAIDCHTFLKQHFAYHDNIKTMSYSTFIAFMKETRTEPLKKRHKQQLQMLLANNTETQGASICASVRIENDAILENKDSATQANIPSSGCPSRRIERTMKSSHLSIKEIATRDPDQQSAEPPCPKAPKVSKKSSRKVSKKSSKKASKSTKAPTAPKASKTPTTLTTLKSSTTPKSSKRQEEPEAPKAAKTPRTTSKTPKGSKTAKKLRKKRVCDIV